jgi:hypothetical protein
LIEHSLLFIVKGRDGRSFKSIVPFIPGWKWEYVDYETSVYDAGVLDIPGSKKSARIILIKYLKKDNKEKYGFLATNLSDDAVTVFKRYNDRECIESVIRTNKSLRNMKSLRTRDFCGITAFLYFVFITHNLLNLFNESILKSIGLSEVGPRDMVTKLMQMPAIVNRDENRLNLWFPDKHPYTCRFVPPHSTTTC